MPLTKWRQKYEYGCQIVLQHYLRLNDRKLSYSKLVQWL